MDWWELPPDKGATQKLKRPRVTAQRVALLHALPEIEKENLSAREAAKLTGISEDAASKNLSIYRRKIAERASQYIAESKSKLVEEAQRAQTSGLARLSELSALVDESIQHVRRMAPRDGEDGHPQALDELGQPVPFCAKTFVQAVAMAVKAGKELNKFSEEITGKDVAKQVAVRMVTNQSGPMQTWDGVDALAKSIEAGIVVDVDAVQCTEDRTEDLQPILTASLPAHQDEWDW